MHPYSTEGGTRTRTPKALDPKSSASTNFATSAFGGEKEIRTPGALTSTPPFQGGTIDLSVISPYEWCLNLAYSLPFALAEAQGFEPRLQFPVKQFSRLPHSTTLPNLHVRFCSTLALSTVDMNRILTKVPRRDLHRKPDQSRWRDSNPRQADYKSATLPTELQRP